jgi:hypothetical protein
LIREIAAWPQHLPYVIVFFGLMTLLLALSLRRRARWVVAFLGVLILAFAGVAAYLHAESGFEQLMDAVDRGDAAGVRSLLAKSDPGIVNQLRGTGGGRGDSRPITWPLLVAAQRKQPEIGRILIEHGADVKLWDRARRTSLHWAVDRDTTFMALLLAKGAVIDAHDKDLITPLDLAIDSGEMAPVEFLLAHGASVRTAQSGNVTALHRVTSAELAAVLCAYEAQPNWPDNDGSTPSARARKRGDAAMAAFLDTDDGPCVWLRTRPGVASPAARQAAVHEYDCEQLKAQAAVSTPERRSRQSASCYLLGRALENGDAREPSADRASAAYGLACQYGHSQACTAVAAAGRSGSERR